MLAACLPDERWVPAYEHDFLISIYVQAFAFDPGTYWNILKS